MQQATFVIDSAGNILTIYDDSLAELIDNGGEIVTRRASHVEPQMNTAGLWSADLSPVGGPMLAGFSTRASALDAELAWLNEHLPELEIPKK